MKTSDSKFYIDVRDGSLEQHLSNGEVRNFPPSNGKSVSPLVTMLRDTEAQHTATFGSTRGGMSRFPSEVSKPHPNYSGLLAALLSRQ